jgi:hypothetical protein
MESVGGWLWFGCCQMLLLEDGSRDRRKFRKPAEDQRQLLKAATNQILNQILICYYRSQMYMYCDTYSKRSACHIYVPMLTFMVLTRCFIVWPFNKHTPLYPSLPLASSICHFILTLPFSHSISAQRASVASYC